MAKKQKAQTYQIMPSPIRLHLLCIPTAATFLFRFTMIASRVAMIMIHIEDIRHLQILHDVQVEAKICALLPQMDNWLDGTLPLSDQLHHDFGVIVPSVDVDRPLIPVRDLLYKGFGTFALIRTSKDVFSPQNIPEAVYTVLRVDGPGLIGNQKVAIGESIWVSHQTTLSAGLILLIGVFPTVVVGQKV
ncbi:hypothetical protein CBS147347_11354 [Aspergillus niger]|nr:hypothetical protein CBS147347_11354 [Aspergillus niger]